MTGTASDFIETARVRFVARLPEGGPLPDELWLACNLRGWQTRVPGWQFTRLGGDWVLERDLPVGALLDAKVNRGSPDTEEGDAWGARTLGHRLVVEGDTTLHLNVRGWQDAPRPGRPTTVTGRVEDFTLHSPELGVEREVRVWLPPHHDTSSEAFPVMILHDGQNVFDERLAFQGVEWGADEAADALAREGLGVILVALPVGADRAQLYTPFPGRHNGSAPRVAEYTAFLAGTLRDEVRRRFRVTADPAGWAVAGSSFGGLASLFAGLTRPDVFGFVGAFSPSVWQGDFGLLPWVDEQDAPDTRVYVDMGGHEGDDVVRAALMVRQARLLAQRLSERTRETRLVIEPEGWHDEAAWARRFPAVLRWFAESARTMTRQT